MLHANFTSLCFIEPELLPKEVFHIAVLGIFDLFGVCDLDLDPMTFAYELDLYFVDVYCMSENELCTSTLSKVIV